MSRAKFEEWWESCFDGSPTDSDYDIWLAGRESMRDEAADACGNEHLEDPQDHADDAYNNAVFHCKSAIRKIEP